MKLEDLKGKRFGELTVIERDFRENSKKTYWKCKCDCGNIVSIDAFKLKNGHTKSCGCLRNKPSAHRKDYTNQKIGRLTAKYPIKKDNELYWVCDCDCGNKDVEIRAEKLGGKRPTKSCGCIHSEITKSRHDYDLVGYKFNRLTVIERDYDNEEKNDSHKRRRKWKCKCECGNVITLDTATIKSGKQLSCGCVKSKGEYNAMIYFNKISLKYIPQKTYEDLLGVNGGKLSYDFYIPNYNLLIECQGEQHEKPYGYNNSEEQFKIQKEHDKRKKEYAISHNINLLEIWYYDYDNIENILKKVLKR